MINVYTKIKREKGRLDFRLKCKLDYCCNHSSDSSPHSGEIRASPDHTLDYEEFTEIQVRVRATDGGFRPKIAFTDVRIKLTDINDCPPEFDHDSYEASVDENAEAGTRVITVVATDRDSGVHAIINYALVGNSGKGGFWVVVPLLSNLFSSLFFFLKIFYLFFIFLCLFFF